MPVAAMAAFDPFGGVDCGTGGSSQSAVCNDKTSKDPISGDNGLLLGITDIVAFAAGAAAVILIVLGGIRYITSGGSPEKIASAKNTLIGALIGLAVIVLGRALILYVVSKL